MRRIGRRIWRRVCDAADKSVQEMMRARTYRFHPYHGMVRHDRKRRQIDFADKADRPMLDAVYKVLSPELVKKLSPCTYSSIKGRGLTAAFRRARRLTRKYKDGYYVLIDIRHYYESIDQDQLEQVLRGKVKDRYVVDFIMDAVRNHREGLAIGLSIAALLGNLYLTDVDRDMNEELGFDIIRYMDDILVFCRSKEVAHAVLRHVTEMCAAKHLEVKKSARIAPVGSGIIFIGYRIYPTHILLRRNIKERMKRQHRRYATASDEVYKRRMAPYFGWCIYGNCLHLMQCVMGDRYKLFEKNIMKYMRINDKRKKEDYFGLAKEDFVSITELPGREVVIFDCRIANIKGEDKAVILFAFSDDEEHRHYTISRGVIMERVVRDKEEGLFPGIATFVRKKGVNGRNYIVYE